MAEATQAAPASASAPSGDHDPAPARPQGQARGESRRAHRRQYTVYELGGDGDVLIKSTVEAHDPEEACWQLVESDATLKERALKGGDSAPKLDALPLAHALDFQPFVLVEEKNTRRVKGGGA